MFGELPALVRGRVASVGIPSPVSLVELGPGRGTLMADALRALKRAPDLLESADVRLVEASPVLRSRQREALPDHTVSWHDGVGTFRTARWCWLQTSSLTLCRFDSSYVVMAHGMND